MNEKNRKIVMEELSKSCGKPETEIEETDKLVDLEIGQNALDMIVIRTGNVINLNYQTATVAGLISQACRR